jgi:hypothetical protein
MASVNKAESHKLSTGPKQSGIHSEVCGRSRKSLDIDAPHCGIESKCLKGPLLAQRLDLVDVFHASIVSLAWVAFRVFVSQARPDRLHTCLGGEVFRSYKLQSLVLSPLFHLDQLINFRVALFKT